MSTATAWKTFSIGKKSAVPAGPSRSPSILLIEDDVDLSEVLRLLLESCGHRVWVAFNGTQGFDLARDAGPDLILTDIEMPGMHGFDLLRKLRQSEATRRIPVVLHSGSTDAREKQEGLDLGAAAFLSKPCSLAEMRQTIACFLQPVSAMSGHAQFRDLLLSA